MDELERASNLPVENLNSREKAEAKEEAQQA